MTFKELIARNIVERGQKTPKNKIVIRSERQFIEETI